MFITVLVAVGVGTDAPCNLLSIPGIMAIPMSTIADKSGIAVNNNDDFPFCGVPGVVV